MRVCYFSYYDAVTRCYGPLGVCETDAMEPSCRAYDGYYLLVYGVLLKLL